MSRFSIGLAAAMLAGSTLTGGLAASAADDAAAIGHAAKQAQIAGKALARHDDTRAIAAAEAAVALRPGDASYRNLLGRAYLSAGRFDSAAAAFGDALTLSPGQSGTALQLALMQVAGGDWAQARTTLDAHRDGMPVSDYGLALALAGDPARAVAVLMEAARTPGSDVKTRQNLALSLALAGSWAEARAIASLDLSPADLDARMTQWAAFATPRSASDQVATLLGVTPVEDPGQPVQLALSAPANQVAAAAPDPVDAYMPGRDARAPIAAEAAPIASHAAEPTTVAAPIPAVATPVVAGVRFAERREVVQALPQDAPVPMQVASRAIDKSARAAAPRAKLVAAAPVRAAARGDYYVQLGAYENAAVAQDAWGRLTRRHPALGGYQPFGAGYAVQGVRFYRLSVGGFARGDAAAMCRQVRARGGICFVRTGAGDAAAAWSGRAKGIQLASR